MQPHPSSGEDAPKKRVKTCSHRHPRCWSASLEPAHCHLRRFSLAPSGSPSEGSSGARPRKPGSIVVLKKHFQLIIESESHLLGRGVGLLLALLLGHLLALLLWDVLAVSVGNLEKNKCQGQGKDMKKQTTTIGKGSIFLSHLNQFLLLDVATGVVVVLLAGAGHLDVYSYIHMLDLKIYSISLLICTVIYSYA